uniref:Leucine-rich repeats and immunoglobulin-like domains 3 n=1 Tax=Scleropages formosus TaxID=113540 RepID=A0A8C9WQ24_SCLFO
MGLEPFLNVERDSAALRGRGRPFSRIGAKPRRLWSSDFGHVRLLINVVVMCFQSQQQDIEGASGAAAAVSVAGDPGSEQQQCGGAEGHLLPCAAPQVPVSALITLTFLLLLLSLLIMTSPLHPRVHLVCCTSLPLFRRRFMNSNRISSLEPGCFSNLSATLQVLKLNRNRLSSIPAKIFQLPNLQHLELNRNRVKRVDGLAFHGLHSLKSLKMQRNGIGKLMDGAFWGLSNMETLYLEHNNLTEVSKGWLYGLLMLQQLQLSHNAIARIRPDAWEFCQKLSELDLASNHLTRLEESSFSGLSVLDRLDISDNRVSFIADGAFRGLSHLQTLDLRNNDISWTIEDMNGPFSALDHLRQLHLNTSSLLCDCQLKWLPPWVAERRFAPFINASCAHPQVLKGRSVFAVDLDDFVCDDFPKPQITVQPETQSALRGSNVTFVCSAASSSDSPMTFAWKKDNEGLSDAEVHNEAHLRARGADVTEYTTVLHLRQVDFASEGKYQCVISNHFGSSYSNKAKLTVNMLPTFTKMPMDLTIRAGATARLECAATGHPAPQIAWQKDGGTDFPAARERRMHVMPEDDVFFIVDVTPEDIGVYSCTAQNVAGAISANATLTVLETPSFLRPLVDRTVARGETAVLQCIAGGSPPPRLNWTKDGGPLLLTERHFFAAGNQLLIIVDSAEADAGKYTCEMSNPLGTERGNVRLGVLPGPNCESGPNGAAVEEDGWTTVGIVIIAVVCCVVGTSLVWVVIIYHTRRRNEDCSVTNTDETNLPADIPSYLSSQGTLAERQDAYVPSENGSSHQFMASSVGGFYSTQKDMNGARSTNANKAAEMRPVACGNVDAAEARTKRAERVNRDFCTQACATWTPEARWTWKPPSIPCSTTTKEPSGLC